MDEYERALGLKEIPSSTIEEWRKAFVEMDVDKSGTLTVQEIHKGLLKIGVNIPESDISEFIRNVDDNGDGVLSVDEFTALMRLNS
ncbi:unnamed protein product [Hymenolepis diminuta]|uniref:EF-hand domain-containing protein n=1 Tax=Hymenolepis diminuta TaxID=6216 RepID=A0A3P7A5D4_HYMDI|nr:unnamed protein product [Hymenolepis diminuta]